jgi:hypothetical protein
MVGSLEPEDLGRLLTASLISFLYLLFFLGRFGVGVGVGVGVQFAELEDSSG